MQDVNSIEYKSITKQHKWVIAEVYGDNCGACRILQAQLQKIKEKYTDIKVIKINSSNETDFIKKELGLRTIPTTILYLKNIAISAFEGFRPISEIERWLSRHGKQSENR